MQPSGPIDSFADTDVVSLSQNDLTREVYGVMGIPIDAVDMATVLRRIESAVSTRTPFFISTANLNFLVASQFDAEFRTSLLLSDLCTADGMPIVWIARLLGVPIRERLAGSDLFEALKSKSDPTNPIKIFLFGGAEGVAAAACKKLNSEGCGMCCVGSLYPGFTTVDEMSSDAIIGSVNSSNADVLAAALGAKKGQAWLLRNHDSIHIPIRAHLGATIGFQAGTVKRAPARLQKWGLEWLWRIKEERQLWKRYWADGMVFLQLLLTRVVPLVAIMQWSRLKRYRQAQDLAIERVDDQNSITLSLNGFAVVQNIGQAIASFQDAVVGTKDIVINFSNTGHIDARFLGLLSMLNKQLGKRRLKLTCARVPRRVERIFRLSGFQFLLGH